MRLCHPVLASLYHVFLLCSVRFSHSLAVSGCSVRSGFKPMVIKKCADTEIDWIAYMQEVEGVIISTQTNYINTNKYTLTLSYTHTTHHTLSLSLSLSLSLFSYLSLSLSLVLSLSLLHTHTHTHKGNVSLSLPLFTHTHFFTNAHFTHNCTSHTTPGT